MPKKRESVTSLSHFFMMLLNLYILLHIVGIISITALVAVMIATNGVPTEFPEGIAPWITPALITAGIDVILLFIGYIINIKKVFGKAIDVIYNVLFSALAIGGGAAVGFLIYPSHFTVDRWFLPGGNAENIVLVIYFFAPFLAMFIPYLTYGIYAFRIYSRSAADWFLLPLFMILMLLILTLILFFAKWLIIVVGQIIGTIAFLFMLPAIISIAVYYGITR